MENQNSGFDRNQLIGFVLIAVIMVGFGWWQSKNMPEPVPQETFEEVVDVPGSSETTEEMATTVAAEVVDSNAFVPQEITVENEDLKLTYSTLGAQLVRAQIKGYQTYDSAEVMIVNNNQVWDIKLPGEAALSTKEFNVVSQNATSLVLSDGATQVEVNLEETGFLASYTVRGTSSAAVSLSFSGSVLRIVQKKELATNVFILPTLTRFKKTVMSKT